MKESTHQENILSKFFYAAFHLSENTSNLPYENEQSIEYIATLVFFIFKPFDNSQLWCR